MSQSSVIISMDEVVQCSSVGFQKDMAVALHKSQTVSDTMYQI